MVEREIGENCSKIDFAKFLFLFYFTSFRTTFSVKFPKVAVLGQFLKYNNQVLEFNICVCNLVSRNRFEKCISTKLTHLCGNVLLRCPKMAKTHVRPPSFLKLKHARSSMLYYYFYWYLAWLWWPFSRRSEVEFGHHYDDSLILLAFVVEIK